MSRTAAKLTNILLVVLLPGCAGSASRGTPDTMCLTLDAAREGGASISVTGYPAVDVHPLHEVVAGTTDSRINRQTVEEENQKLLPGKRVLSARIPSGDGGVCYVAHNLGFMTVTLRIKYHKPIRIEGAEQDQPIVLKPGAHGIRILAKEDHATLEHVHLPPPIPHGRKNPDKRG